jgi:hypothetical protein
MSQRPQVLLPDEEMSVIQHLARGERLTVGGWVRRAVREARMRRPVNGPETTLKAVRRGADHSCAIGIGEKVHVAAGILARGMNRS